MKMNESMNRTGDPSDLSDPGQALSLLHTAQARDLHRTKPREGRGTSSSARAQAALTFLTFKGIVWPFLRTKSGRKS